MPYRSVAHLRLDEALARDGTAEIEVQGPSGSERWTVTAITARTITLAPCTPA